MSTDKKTSALVEQQFPQYIREEGPNFVAFIKAYYEWMEQANNALETSKNLPTYQDIDTTYDKYFEYFHREIMQTIPRTTLADKTLLAKHIREVYRTRGSENSYKLLFRVLFDDEISFYYPGEDILRASDGRWTQDNTIRISEPRNGDVSSFLNESVVGETSAATARVVRSLKTISGGSIVDELYLLEIEGVFQDNERVSVSSDSSIYATIFNTSGPLQSINSIVNGGSSHQSGDSINLTSASGSGANGIISATSDQSAVDWTIIDGGEGYTVGATVTIDHNGGLGTGFTVASISNTEIIQVAIDTIEPVKNVVLNTGPTFVSLGANTAAVNANFAAANVSSSITSALTFSNTTVGTINSLSISSGGYDYATLPTASVVQNDISGLNIVNSDGDGFKGRDASITAAHIPGTITDVTVSNYGADYSKYELVTISNTSRAGTVDGVGVPNVSGIVAYPGKYTDTKGWVSWNNKLQDNYYYQEFSYEIKSNEFVNTYRKFVTDILHPGGTKLFGRVALSSNVEPTVVSISALMNISSISSVDVPTIVEGSEVGYLAYAANTTFKIIPEMVLSPDVVTTETAYTLFAAGTGNLFVDTDEIINSYASELISTYGDVLIGDLGTGKLVTGNNTIFSVELEANDSIIISDVNSGSPPPANGLYTVNIVYSNTALGMTQAYAYGDLSQGTFHYSSNTNP